MAVKPSASAVCAFLRCRTRRPFHAANSQLFQMRSFLLQWLSLNLIKTIQAVATSNSWYLQEGKESPTAANFGMCSVTGDREGCLVDGSEQRIRLIRRDVSPDETRCAASVFPRSLLPADTRRRRTAGRNKTKE